MKNLTEKKRKLFWRITCIAAVILIVIAFTPLIIPAGKINPKLLSMPFTLWINMLITIALVFLTYIGGRLHLYDDEE